MKILLLIIRVDKPEGPEASRRFGYKTTLNGGTEYTRKSTFDQGIGTTIRDSINLEGPFVNVVLSIVSLQPFSFFPDFFAFFLFPFPFPIYLLLPLAKSTLIKTLQ